MSVKLMIDPVSRRIVYVARNGVLPERVMFMEAGRHRLFTASTCEVVEYSGELPAGVNAQKCWRFRVGDRGIEEAA